MSEIEKFLSATKDKEDARVEILHIHRETFLRLAAEIEQLLKLAK